MQEHARTRLVLRPGHVIWRAIAGNMEQGFLIIVSLFLAGLVGGEKQDMSDLHKLDHHALVRLMHRAAATPDVMARVAAETIAGQHLAGLTAAEARELLNCSAKAPCFRPRVCTGEGEAVDTGSDPRERLVHVLDATREMHPNLLAYARGHARARLLAPSEANRFLVWTCGCCGEPCSGWGNRMLGIVSALMLALLTDRTFLIHWPDDACIPLSAVLGSEWIDWRLPAGFRGQLSPQEQAYLVNQQPIHGFELSIMMRTFDPRSHDDKSIIWMRASHGLFIDLWRNPYVSDQLCAYGFNTVDTTYATLSRLLLTTPQGDLAAALTEALSSPRVAGKLVVGLQMRFTEVLRLAVACKADSTHRRKDTHTYKEREREREREREKHTHTHQHNYRSRVWLWSRETLSASTTQREPLRRRRVCRQMRACGSSPPTRSVCATPSWLGRTSTKCFLWMARCSDVFGFQSRPRA